MTPLELLNLAEQRLLALDEETRGNGRYAERVAVSQAIVDLAEARARYELMRLQGIEAEQRIRRADPMFREAYREWELRR